MTMPTIFVSHGSPTLILDDVPARAFLASLVSSPASAEIRVMAFVSNVGDAEQGGAEM